MTRETTTQAIVEPIPARAHVREPSPTRVLARLPGAIGAAFKRSIGQSWLEPSLGEGILSNLGIAAEGEVVREPYKQEPWVFACVDLLSIVASGVRLNLYDRDPEDPDANLLEEGHPVRNLFESVNPLMDPAILAIADAQDISLSGEVFWFFRNALDGKPTFSIPPDDPNGFVELPDEIWPVRGDLVMPAPRQDGGVAGWRVPTAGGKIETWPIASTLQFYERPDRKRPGRGLGRLAAAFGPVSQNYLARRYQNVLLRNIGDPGGVVVVGGFLSDTEWERMEAELDETWNNPDRAGETRMLEGDAKYMSQKSTPRDMEYGKLLEANKGDISAVFQTPPGLLGADVENYATFAGRFRAYLFTRVDPYFELRSTRLNSAFFPRLRQPEWQGIRARYNTERLREALGELDKQATTVQVLSRAGVPLDAALKIARIRTDEPIAGGDVGFIGNNFLPLEAAALRGRAVAAREIGLAAKALLDVGIEPGPVFELVGIEGLPRIELLPPEEPEEAEEEEPAAEASEQEGEPEDDEEGSEDGEKGLRAASPAVAVVEVRAVRRQARIAAWRAFQRLQAPYRRKMDRGVKRVFFEMRRAQLAALSEFADTGSVSRDVAFGAVAIPDVRARLLDGPERFGRVIRPPAPRLSSSELDSLALALEEDRIEEARIRAADPERLFRPELDCLENEVRRLPVRWGAALARWRERRRRGLRDLSIDVAEEAVLVAKAELDPESIEELLVIQDAKWAEAIAGKIEPFSIEAYVAAAEELIDELGVAILEVRDPAVLRAFAEKAIEVAEGTQSVIARRLRSDLLRALAENTTTGTLQARVAATLKELRAATTRAFNSHAARALAIARTEVGGASNLSRFSSLRAAFDQGLIESIEWFTSGRGTAPGGTVRPSHAANEGLRRVPGETFPNGLTHPLQPGAPAGEVVNCECGIRGVVDSDEEED